MLKKLTFSNIWYSRRENLKKCTSFGEQKKVQGIFGGIYLQLPLVFSCFSSTKQCLRFHLIGFAWEIKGFYQSSLEIEVDFTNILNNFPNILAKNWNFKKLRHGFLDEKAKITTTLISSCNWKILCTFLLAKEKTWKCIFHTNSEVFQNRWEKEIMPFKTTVN